MECNNLVIQAMIFLYPTKLEVTNSHWKGHVFTIPKRSPAKSPTSIFNSLILKFVESFIMYEYN